MKENNNRGKNFVAYIVLFIWLSFMIIAFTLILKPEIELGDSVFRSSDYIPIELGIVECDCVNLYLFDSTRKKIMVYDSEGDNIANYDFSFSGTVRVTDIDEEDETIVVYYYRIHKFYDVSFDGEVISIRNDDIGYIDDYLEISENANDYIIQNNFLWYSVYLNQELLFRRVSLLPIVLMSISLFFGGIIFSVKRIKSKKEVL